VLLFGELLKNSLLLNPAGISLEIIVKRKKTKAKDIFKTFLKNNIMKTAQEYINKNYPSYPNEK